MTSQTSTSLKNLLLRLSKTISFIIILTSINLSLIAQTTYTWIGTDGASWAVGTNWSPARTPAVTDILQFNDGGTYTITNVPTESIGRLLISNNSEISLESTGDRTLTLRGTTATINLLVESGSKLKISSTGTNRLGITFNNVSGQLADISGELIINPNTAKTNWFTTTYSTTITSVNNGGKIINNGGVITGALIRLQFLSGSEYQHNRDGGIVPTATWDNNSKLIVSGIVSTIATGFNQAFGHFYYNCTAQTANLNLNTTSNMTCNGDFYMQSTGTGSITIATGSGYYWYLNGDFNFENGTINMNNTGANVSYIDIKGNFNQTGGTFQRGTSTGIQRIRFVSNSINKTFSITAGTFSTTGINFEVIANAILSLNSSLTIDAARTFIVYSGGTINFNNNLQGTGTLTINSGGVGYLLSDISVSPSFNCNGSLYCYDNVINGTGNFVLGNTTTVYIYIGHSGGINLAGISDGNIQNSGTRTYGATANYIYNGSVDQNTGTGLASASNITINNPGNILRLSSDVSISTTLYLQAGILDLQNYTLTLANTNNTTAISGTPSISNMIITNGNGFIKKNFVANSTIPFIFPLGDNVGNIEYTPANLNFIANSSGYVSCNLKDEQHPAIIGLADYLSRYWSFQTTMSSYNYSLNFDFIDPDDINGTVSEIKAARYNGSIWSTYPSTISSGNISIATSPLNTVTCPLNNNIFSGIGQEVLCESTNGFLHETFTSTALPTGWTSGYFQGTNNWVIKNSPGLSSASGSYYAVFDDWALGSGVTPNEAWIKTKDVSFCGLSSIYLSYYEFWYGVENTYGYVEISTNGGITWTTVNTNNTTTVGSLAAPVKTIIDITALLDGYSSVIVRFRYKEVEAVGRYWYIDDINIYAGQDVGVSELITPAVLDCSANTEYSSSEQISMRVYNYSYEDVANIDWTCEVTGGTTGSYSGTIANIPADSYADIIVGTIDMSADAIYHFAMSATPQLPVIDGNLTNNTLYEGRRQKVATFPYFEDFNTSKGGWSEGGENPQPPNTAIPNHNGREFYYGELPYLGGPEGEGNSWYVKTTTNGTYDQIWLESPTFDFSTVNNPVFSMDIKYQLNTYYSYFQVQYSINDGATWIQIGNNADADWYQGNTNYWYGNVSSPVSVWTHVEHQLCLLSGKSCVKFRVFGYAYYGISGINDYRSNNYFAVDNIGISAGDPDDLEPIALSLNSSGNCTTYGSTETIQLLINNNTCRPITNVPVTLQVDGGTVLNETIPGPVPGNGSYLYSFTNTANLSAPGSHSLVVSVNLPTDGVPANNVISETRFNNKIIVDAANPYIQDFNSGNQGWVSRVSSATDGTRHFRLDSLPYLNGSEGEGSSWFVETSTHANYTLFWVESPVFNLSTSANPTMFMDIKYKLNTYYSYYHVEYSINGGTSWVQLGTNADPNWYEGNTNWWYGNLSNPIVNWEQVQHSLCNLVGQSCVKFRIYGYAYYGPQADNSNLIAQIDYSDNNYFAFDNFKIIDAPEVGVIAIITPNASVSGCLYDQNQLVTIEVENYSCSAVNNIPVKCRIDLPVGHPDYATSPLLFSGIVPSIGANNSSNFTFSTGFDMTPMGEYIISSWTEMIGDLNIENDTANMSIEVNFPKISTFPYLEDFNANNGFWTAGGANPPDNNGRKFVWGNLPYLNGPDGEGKSWYVQTTTNGSYDLIWVESPVFDFSNLSDPSLSMDIKYQLNTYYSYFQVQYSKDGGTVWTQLGNNTDPNWYQGNTNWWYGNVASPINNWTQVQRDLCELAGEPCIKFRVYGYAYYGGVANEHNNYFAIDNFRVVGSLADDAEPIAITLNNSGICGAYSSAETMQVLINNNLCRPLYNVPVTLNLEGVDVLTEIIPGPIPRFGSYLYTFTGLINLSAAGNHTILVTTNLSSDADNTNDSYSEIRINNTHIAISPGNNYIEDFNTDNGGWVSRISSATDATRHFVKGELPYLNGPEGNGESWYVETTTHTNYTLIGLESPIFDLTSASDPILQMDIKYQLNTYYSYFHVEYSLNGGGTWVQLGTSADPEWYQGNTNWWYGNVTSPVDTWTLVQRKLCELKGNSCVKFRIWGYAYYGPQAPNANLIDQTDYSNNNYFAVDNIRIIDAQDVGVTAVVDPDASELGCLYSPNQTVTVRVYNWSCSDATNVPVTVEISGQATATFTGTVASVPAGSSVNYTFTGTFDMSQIGTYSLNAYTTLVPDANPSNDATILNINVPYPKITTYPYIEDFNSNNGYWIASGQNPPDNNGRNFVWGSLPYLEGHEGEGSSWYVESTTNGAYDLIWIESPVFDFSSVTDPFLLMDIKYQLNTYYSYYQVRYSLNGGSTWTQLGTSADPDWYKGNTNWWYGNLSNPVDDWTTVFHNLCSFAGQPCVKFQIYGYAYYGGVANEHNNYFAMDNFKIIDGFKDASVSDFITPILNEAPCTFDEDKEITVRVKGASCSDLTDVPIYCDINGPSGIVYNLSGIVDIPANTNVIYTFPTTVDLRSVGTYNFSAYTDLIGDDFPINDVELQTIVTLDTLINTFPYFANFDNGTDYWRPGNSTATPTRSFEHGQFDYLNGNDNNGDSWYVNVTTHGSYEMIWLESPIFDLSETSNPILSFMIKYQLYNYYSYFHVEYSINGGSTWTQLGTDVDEDWYVGNTNWWYNNTQNPIDEWTFVEHNLCSLKGQSCVKLRIVGYAYYGISGATDYRYYNFFALDNISVTDTDLDAQLVNVTGCYGTEYHLDLEIENRNDFCQLFEPCSYDGQTAIAFDNSNDRVDLGAFPLLSNFTVEFWVLNPANGVGDYRVSVAAESNRFEVVKMNDGTLQYYLPATGWVNTGRSLPVGKWSHVACVADGVDLKTYLNGEEIHLRSGNYSVPASNWAIGARPNNTYPTNAHLDELKIWNIALSGNDLRSKICNSLLGSESGLLAYYKMEDGTGSSSLTDITGNGHTGALTNMNTATCWVVSNLTTNNNGVARDPYEITSIDVTYVIDGVETTATYPVSITAGASEIISIDNVLIPNGMILGDNVLTGGTATSNQNNADAPKAFDTNILTSGWKNSGTMPCWLQYDLGAGNEHVVNAYRLFCSSTQTPGTWTSESYNPAIWQIQGSNNGTDWDIIDNVYYGNLSKNTWKIIKFDNSTPYRYYRMYNTYGEASTQIHITELQMFHVDPEPSSLVVWVSNPNGLNDEIGINDTIYCNVSSIPHCYDHCAAAIELVDEVTNASSTFNATADLIEDPSFSTTGCTGVTLENTVWFTFNSNCFGSDVQVDFNNIICDISNAGVQISITKLLKDGLGNNLEPCILANHEELFCSDEGDVDSITWIQNGLPANTQYYITIDGVGGSSCDFQIVIQGDMNNLQYRTISDGDWSDLDNWEIYLTTSDEWVPATNACQPHFPTSQDSLINVRHAMTYDTEIVEGIDQIKVFTDIVSTPKIIIPTGINCLITDGIGDDLVNFGQIDVTGSISLEPGVQVINQPLSIFNYNGANQDLLEITYAKLWVDGDSPNSGRIKTVTGNDIRVNEVLNFINAKILLNGNLTLGVNASTENDSQTNGYFLATGNGYVIREYPIGTDIARKFPVGGVYYSPAILKFADITTGGTMSCRVREQIHPEHPAAIRRYWNIEKGTIAYNGSYDLTLHYHESDLSGVPATIEEEELMLAFAGAYSLSYVPDNWIYYTLNAGNYIVDVTTNTAIMTHNMFSDMTLLKSDDPLPVTWLYLTAEWVGNDGYLTWATASESNNYGFEIERCSKDCSAFELIGFVKGNDNSNSIKTYNFIDKDLKKNQENEFYYRLKQIDYDNKYSYSNIVNLRKSDSEEYSSSSIISLYPNPSKVAEEIFIVIESETDQIVFAKVTDLIGKEVFATKINLLEGTNIYVLKSGVLSEGAYFLNILFDKKSVSKKFIIATE